MKTYNWWLKQKRRVRKKYTLFLGKYMSPKEMREWHKRLKGRTVCGVADEYIDGKQGYDTAPIEDIVDILANLLTTDIDDDAVILSKDAYYDLCLRVSGSGENDYCSYGERKE